jgi:hypothetical protein
MRRSWWTTRLDDSDSFIGRYTIWIIQVEWVAYCGILWVRQGRKAHSFHPEAFGLLFCMEFRASLLLSSSVPVRCCGCVAQYIHVQMRRD